MNVEYREILPPARQERTRQNHGSQNDEARQILESQVQVATLRLLPVSVTMDATYFDTFLRAVENTPIRDRLGVLGDDYLVFPPQPDYGYEATPRNALTFGSMGVDGVHYAILRIDGEVTDESPVIHVGPMDFSEPYVILGDCFLSYLAAACGVSIREMESVFEEERAGRGKLVPFLKERFVHSRLYDEMRLRKLEHYLELVEPKS